MRVLLTVTLLIGCQLACAKFIPGRCPEYHSVPEFDLTKYLGRWYEMQHISSNYEEGDQCITTDFGYISDTEMSIKDSWVDEKGLSSIAASAALTGAEPGEFLFTFEGQVPDYFTVLAVDYERYSAAYACRQSGELINEFGWIHFRSNFRNETLLTEILSVYTKLGIDVKQFDFTYQGPGCQYTDAP